MNDVMCVYVLVGGEMIIKQYTYTQRKRKETHLRTYYNRKE